MTNEKIYKTIIVGGGISGLSCAKHLSHNNDDFLIITRETNGRIQQNQNKDINYGAYYVISFYRHFLKFAKKTERLTIFKISFFDNQLNGYTVFDKRLFSSLGQLLRFVFILLRFRSKYDAFRQKCQYVEQKEAIQADKFLLKIYQQNALEFIKENRLEKLADSYISKIFWGQTFSPLAKVNAFTFLEFSLPLITPTYKFIFLNEEIISGFKDKIVMGEIRQITKENEVFRLEDASGKHFLGENLVMSTPINITQELLKNIAKIEETKKPVSVHVYQLKGTLKDDFQKREINVFSPGENIFSLAAQSDGTFLLYTPNEYSLFERFFQQYETLGHTFWNPAFNIDGSALLKCNIEKNIYLANDHNICGLEDSYIQGMYVAKKLSA